MACSPCGQSVSYSGGCGVGSAGAYAALQGPSVGGSLSRGAGCGGSGAAGFAARARAAGLQQGAQIPQFNRGARNNGCIPPAGTKNFSAPTTYSTSEDTFTYSDAHQHDHIRHHVINYRHTTAVHDVIHLNEEEGCAEGGVFSAPAQSRSIGGPRAAPAHAIVAGSGAYAAGTNCGGGGNLQLGGGGLVGGYSGGCGQQSVSWSAGCGC